MTTNPPSATDVLDAWERAAGQPAWARPLCLLAAGADQLADQWRALATLPVGARDDRLIALRVSLFGDRADAVATCPACGEAAEVELALADLRTPEAIGPDAGVVEVAGYDVTFRLPTTVDLVEVPHTDDAEAALLERCVTSVRATDGSEAPPASLPAEAVHAVSAAMAELDRAGDIVLELTCPACAEAWPAPFDIAAFLWDEVDAWCERTLGEVDALARTYGWTEPEVLALSPYRRRRYLELAWP